jgi:hypothetical protein
MTTRKPMSRTLAHSSNLARGRALAPARGRSAGSTKPGEWIADFLVKYLNTSEPDPYDFRFVLPFWAEEERVKGIDEDTSVDDLSDKDYARFSKWLLSQSLEDMAGFTHEPGLIPSYIFMTNAQRLPERSWLIHFTDASPFLSFDRGATLSTPLWSTGIGNQRAVRAHCPQNIAEGRSPYEVVFGYAFSLTRKLFDEGRLSLEDYGRNAVLFQCDVAVECDHLGDEDTQTVFPICTEYNAIPVLNVNALGGGEVKMGRDAKMFDTAQDIIASFHRSGVREGRALGTTRKGRWHPLVALPRGAK